MHFNGQVPNYRVSHARSRNHETSYVDVLRGNDFLTSAQSRSSFPFHQIVWKGYLTGLHTLTSAVLWINLHLKKKLYKLKACCLGAIIKQTCIQTNIYAHLRKTGYYYWWVKLHATPKPIMDKDGEENENEIAKYQNYIDQFVYKENLRNPERQRDTLGTTGQT